MLVTRLSISQRLPHTFADGRGGYVYLIEGAARLDDHQVATGDAAEVEGPHSLAVEAGTDCELMLVDVPLHYRPVGIWAATRAG